MIKKTLVHLRESIATKSHFSKVLGILFSACLLVGFVTIASSKIGDQGSGLNVEVKFAREDLDSSFPTWMPDNWKQNFRKQLELSSGLPLIERDMDEMLGELNEKNWVERVNLIKRNYKGELSISVRFHKPICVMKAHGNSLGFVNRECQKMTFVIPPKLGGDLIKNVKGELVRPPVLDYSKILDVEAKKFKVWLKEIIQLICEIKDTKSIGERIRITRVIPSVYKTRKSHLCILEIFGVDNTFNKEFKIKWGINSFSTNPIELKSNKVKIKEIEELILTSHGPVRNLDLSMTKPKNKIF